MIFNNFSAKAALPVTSSVIIALGLIDGPAAHEGSPQESPLAVGLLEVDGRKFRICRKQGQILQDGRAFRRRRYAQDIVILLAQAQAWRTRTSGRTGNDSIHIFRALRATALLDVLNSMPIVPREPSMREPPMQSSAASSAKRQAAFSGLQWAISFFTSSANDKGRRL